MTNSLLTLFPTIAEQWHPEKNDGVTPDQVVAHSHKKRWWKCPNGPDHEWFTTSGSRAGSGTGCPYCSVFPRSRQEIGLAFELLYLFDFDINDHKERIGDLIYDCDIIIREHGLIVEFDGSYWHDGHDQYDLEKTAALKEAHWNVIRVRQKPLRLLSPMDISVPKRGNAKHVVDAVLLKVRDELNIRSERLDDYLKAPGLQNGKASEAFIRRSLHPSNKKPGLIRDL